MVTSTLYRISYITHFIIPYAVQDTKLSLISKLRRVLNDVFLLSGDSPAFEFYVPTFWNTLYFPSSQVVQAADTTYEDGTRRSEISADKCQTQGNHPKERIQFQDLIHCINIILGILFYLLIDVGLRKSGC
jgi:hypothetical protein